jgi:hypothetical protein
VTVSPRLAMMENENSSQDHEDLSQNIGGQESTHSSLPSHRYHQLYPHHEEEFIDHDSFSKILIPSKSSSPFYSKFSLPHLMNQDKDHLQKNNKNISLVSLTSHPSIDHPKILEKKVSVEVILTEEHLKELMKCKPTNEWVSKTGKQLKYSFPELTKASQADLKNQQQINSRQSYEKNLEPLPIEIQYNTISNWKGIQAEEKIQILYLKLLKYILFRESSLQRMESLLDSLEQWYWKYSCLVIDRVQFRKSILTEELNQMVRIIHSKQQELSVAIAHHRTLSINVVEAVVR